MHFDLVDRVLELTDDRVVTLKSVSLAEEYLQDHFPSFPVLPGVFMIEAMVQAARKLLTHRDDALARHVLGSVKALKYGTFVSPGKTMRITVTLHKDAGDGTYEFKGRAEILSPGTPGTPEKTPAEPPPTCVSGRFTMRPNTAAPALIA